MRGGCFLLGAMAFWTVGIAYAADPFPAGLSCENALREPSAQLAETLLRWTALQDPAGGYVLDRAELEAMTSARKLRLIGDPNAFSAARAELNAVLEQVVRQGTLEDPRFEGQTLDRLAERLASIRERESAAEKEKSKVASLKPALQFMEGVAEYAMQSFIRSYRFFPDRLVRMQMNGTPQVDFHEDELRTHYTRASEWDMQDGIRRLVDLGVIDGPKGGARFFFGEENGGEESARIRAALYDFSDPYGPRRLSTRLRVLRRERADVVLGGDGVVYEISHQYARVVGRLLVLKDAKETRLEGEKRAKRLSQRMPGEFVGAEIVSPQFHLIFTKDPSSRSEIADRVSLLDLRTMEFVESYSAEEWGVQNTDFIPFREGEKPDELARGEFRQVSDVLARSGRKYLEAVRAIKGRFGYASALSVWLHVDGKHWVALERRMKLVSKGVAATDLYLHFWDADTLEERLVLPIPVQPGKATDFPDAFDGSFYAWFEKRQIYVDENGVLWIHAYASGQILKLDVSVALARESLSDAIVR